MLFSLFKFYDINRCLGTQHRNFTSASFQDEPAFTKEVSLSPFTSSQIGCHAYFLSYKFVAHFLLSFVFASMCLNRDYRRVHSYSLKSSSSQQKGLSVCWQTLHKWLMSCFGLFSFQCTRFLYFQKYIQFSKGKIFPSIYKPYFQMLLFPLFKIFFKFF